MGSTNDTTFTKRWASDRSESHVSPVAGREAYNAAKNFNERGADLAVRATTLYLAPGGERSFQPDHYISERLSAADLLPDSFTWTEWRNSFGEVFGVSVSRNDKPISLEATAHKALDELAGRMVRARGLRDLVTARTLRKIGAALVFPSPSDPAKAVSKDLASGWLLEAERLAELPKLRQGVWHPYRRKWATARKHESLADVAAAGDWKSKETLLRCYQQPDSATMLNVVLGGRELREKKA